MWRWKSKPFGESQPNQDVDGNGNNFVYNLRFPGQYYDVETKTHYNYRRDYNPNTGRYVQSDPIGISGGIGTYSYANNSPLMGRDSRGENPFAIFAAAVVITAPIVIPIISNAISDTLDVLSDINVFTNRGNVADTQIKGDFEEEASLARLFGNEPPDRCEWLEANKDRYRDDQVKATQKAWGCRRSRSF